jgi:cystathionine beta-synthase
MLHLIGNTPIVELTGFDTGLCRLFVKLEYQNPGGSIKDRIALSMIRDAEARGVIQPGGTIVEATAGNTGLGLAFLATQKRYKLILVIPDKMSREKINHLRAMGAQIVITRSDVGKGHPSYYQDLAAEIARTTPGAWYVNQFGNPANAQAHEDTTAPEIWEQMQHDVDAVVCGVGSGGTITGISRYFKRVAPKLEMVLADPAGSILAHYIKTKKVSTEVGSWLVEGIGEDFIPDILDVSNVHKAYTVSDKESLLTARSLLKNVGILAGSSSGTLVAAALAYCKEQSSPKRVVTFICDSGNKYLSKMFNDFWMIERGFISRAKNNDLRDLISRPYQEGAVISLSPEDTLAKAYGDMKLYEVSQLPVLENDRITGIIDEGDLLESATKGLSLHTPVRQIMTTKLVTLTPDNTREELLEVLNRGLTAIIQDDKSFYGLITRIDYINYLRNQV